METRKLFYVDVAPHMPAFHAAHATFAGDRYVALHYHDFYEWVVVLDGEARHMVNGLPYSLRAGDLVLIRPEDKHAIYPTGQSGIEFVNIAFPQDVWRDYSVATGLEEFAKMWANAEAPISVELTPYERQTVTAEALNAVRRYHNTPTRLAFSAFWSAAAGVLALRAGGGDDVREKPLWLHNLLAWVNTAEAEDLTLESLTEASGVSFGHLSRTLKAMTGFTPSEVITDTRVKKAAYELATTDKDVTTIAFDCGFENLSYFYRRFRQIHGKTPRVFREEAKRSLP